MIDLLPDPIPVRAAEVIAALVAQGATIATAESCTGGLIVGALTSVAGSSDAVYGGFVIYANRAKETMIGVRGATLARFGAVSEETAREMAEGARRATGVTYAIAVTGIAGPGGGTADKPVGLVWFALAGPAGIATEERRFGDRGRSEVRAATVLCALDLLIEVLERSKA